MKAVDLVPLTSTQSEFHQSSSMTAIDLFEYGGRSRATTLSKKDKPLFLTKQSQRNIIDKRLICDDAKKVEEDNSLMKENARLEGNMACPTYICRLPKYRDPLNKEGVNIDLDADLVDFMDLLKYQRIQNEKQRLLLLSRNPESFESKLKKGQDKKAVRKLKFKELICFLCGPDPDSVLGCPINYSDTAFFEEGKVTDIIKTDSEGFIVRQKFEHWSVLQDICTQFLATVRERWKEVGEEELMKQQMMVSVEPAKGPPLKKKTTITSDLDSSPKYENSSSGNSPSSSNQQRKKVQPQKVEQILQTQKDVKYIGIFRFKKAVYNPPKEDKYKVSIPIQAIKFANEVQFLAEFQANKYKDVFWSTLDCVQTCIKGDRSGLGKHIYFPFKVEVSPKMILSDLEREIKYYYKAVGQEFVQEIIRRSEQANKYTTQCIKLL